MLTLENLGVRKNGRESTPSPLKSTWTWMVTVSLTFPNFLPFGASWPSEMPQCVQLMLFFAQTLGTFLSPQRNVHGNSILERPGPVPPGPVYHEKGYSCAILAFLIQAGCRGFITIIGHSYVTSLKQWMFASPPPCPPKMGWEGTAG